MDRQGSQFESRQILIWSRARGRERSRRLGMQLGRLEPSSTITIGITLAKLVSLLEGLTLNGKPKHMSIIALKTNDY